MQDEREKRARDLYERMARRKGCTEPLTWEQMHEDGRGHYRAIVDVIGEIERERHPMLAVKADAPTEGLSAAYLAEVATRCAAATPGPWEWMYTANNAGMPLGEFKIPAHNGGATVEMLADDAAFIAHVREDVPALLGEVERLRKARQPLTEAEARAWIESERPVSAYGGKGELSVDEVVAIVMRANRRDIPPEVRPSKPAPKPITEKQMALAEYEARYGGLHKPSGALVYEPPPRPPAGLYGNVPAIAEYVPDDPHDHAPDDAPDSDRAQPWNWCPKCKQDVQDDMRTGEFRDGSEGTCIGCGTVYVAVAYEGGEWALEPRDAPDSVDPGDLPPDSEEPWRVRTVEKLTRPEPERQRDPFDMTADELRAAMLATKPAKGGAS